MPAADTKTDSFTHPARGWTGRVRGGVLGNWIFIALVRLCGLRAAYLLLAFVSPYYLLFAPAARRASVEYRQRLGCGRRSWLARLWGTYRHFFSFGQMLLDRVAILSGRADAFHFELDGEEHIREALDEGNGAVVVSVHCGNWEAAAQLLRRFNVPVNVVAYQGETAPIRRLFEKADKARDFSLIEVGRSPDASIAIMAALRRGEVVAMHADRVTDDGGVLVPFLGAAARFPTGPFNVAAVSGAPLIHAFAMREGTYRYHFYAYPHEHLDFARRKQRAGILRASVRRFVKRLEEKLRQYPLQWNNFYPFWQAGHDAEEGSLA